jgi:hypothetical protein
LKAVHHIFVSSAETALSTWVSAGFNLHHPTVEWYWLSNVALPKSISLIVESIGTRLVTLLPEDTGSRCVAAQVEFESKSSKQFHHTLVSRH